MEQNLKDLLEKLSTDEMYDFIDSKEVKEAYKDCYTSELSGWRNIIYFNGELNISGLLSEGNTLMSIHNGEAIELASITRGLELDGDVVTLENIEDLEDFKEFKEFVLEREYAIEDLLEKSQEEKSAMLNEISFFDSLYCEFNRDNYMKLIDKAIELEWDVYGRDKLIEDIYNAVEMIRDAEE